MAQGDFTRVNTNIGALNALNSLKQVQKNMGTSQLRLATGKRINEAADDPAGLTIATKFQYRASGLGVALDNIGDAKNMLAVAEGGLTKINDILIKMRDKAEQAASDTLGADERGAIKNQLDDFATEINDIVSTTKWNGKKLLDGLTGFDTVGGKRTVTFQTGVETTQSDRIELNSDDLGAADANGLGIGSGASSATEVSDTGTVIVDGATTLAGQARVGGLKELSSGTYTVRVVRGATTDGSSADSYAQLLDADGNPLTVDANGDGAAGVNDNKVTYAHNAGGNNDIDFGNGLKIRIRANIGLGAQTDATVSYSTAGNYKDTVDTASNARTAVTNLDEAIKRVSSKLQTIGAVVSRMNFREETVTVAKVNVEAAHNRIMNADMAYEQLESTKAGILQQTATAMLSQANQAPQGILSLFR